MKTIKNIVTALLLILTGSVAVFALSARDLEPGAISIDGKLQLEYNYHKLGNNWSVTKAGYRDTNNLFTLNESTPSVPSWNGSFGQTAFLDLAMKPYANLTAEFGFEFISNYAERYWIPMNYEHRMKAESTYVSLIKSDVRYKYDWLNLRYFRGIGHYHWGYEGDMFGLYPEQFEPERYLRLTGQPVPEGAEVKMKGKYGSLLLLNGPEIIWGYKNATYAKYNFFISRVETCLIYMDHKIPYGEPDETMRTFEFSAKQKIADRPLMLGVLYRPFRLNKSYDYVEEVAAGSGDFGTQYLKKSGVTGGADASGYSLSYDFMPRPFVNNFIVKYSNLGLVAGNKQEYTLSANKIFTKSINLGIDYIYRKPLLGPIPFIQEGTVANPGPAIFVPRNSQSPFWVNWDNREANIISTVLTFDPTPGTWFYIYQPNLPDAWNLNPAENAPISFAARYSLAKYNTGTDALYYNDSNGQVVWEPSTVAGAWATNDYIAYFDIITKIAFRKIKLMVDLGMGESLAKSSFAYTTATTKEKPSTDSFTAGFGIAAGMNDLKLRYSQDVWGPEEWHRNFGQTFDKLYQVDYTRKLGEHVDIGVSYTGAREIDKKYFANELGDYDEIRGVFTIAFGPVFGYFSEAPEEAAITGEAPLQDNTPPQVKLKLASNTFTPDGDGTDDTLAIELFASDENMIDKWNVLIKDDKGRTVKTITGKGEPPYSIEWDGTDDIYEKTAPKGDYTITFDATDGYDNTASAGPVNVTVSIPPKVVIKEVKVTEIDRGLLVSMTSNVLFDSGKSKLKPSADRSLEEVVKILKTYPDNKISVEGHTDNVGNTKVNMRISEERAYSVSAFLMKKGIDKNRITSKGWGKDKPFVSNSTAAGREANRRVEVIILKQEKQ